MARTEKEALEDMIEDVSLRNVLNMLAQICYEIEQGKQGKERKAWETVGNLIDEAASEAHDERL